MNERFARAAVMARVELAHEQEFRLGGVVVRPALREVFGNGWSEILEPRVMQVLVVLARAEPHVVSREDLTEACWEGRVVGEDALQRCIVRLRKLADSSGAFMLDTVPRVGYRLTVLPSKQATPGKPAVGPEYSSAEANASPDAVVSPAESKSQPARPWPRTAIGAAAVICLVALCSGAWWVWVRNQVPPITIRGPMRAPINSVAVLPFANFTGDPKLEYFSDGFSEDLLNELSSRPELRVPGRTSSFSFKNRNSSLNKIGQMLGVRAIVEGSIRRTGNHLRITAELVNVSDGYVRWSANFDSDGTNILKIRNKIVDLVLARTVGHLPPTPLHRASAMNVEAYRAYLEGQSLLYERTPEGSARALPFLRKATALEPNFADGLAALARAYILLRDFGSVSDSTYLSSAKAAIDRAMQLEPNNLNVLAMHLYLSMELLDWAAAIKDAGTMQHLNPGSPLVLLSMARFYYELGFPEASLTYARAAADLDPLSVSARISMALSLMELTRYEQAIDVFENILRMHREQPRVLAELCQGYARAGRLADAQRIASMPTINADHYSNVCRAEIALALGHRQIAEAMLDSNVTDYGTHKISAGDIGISYALLGFYSKAVDWLNRSYDNREHELFLAYSDKEIQAAFFQQRGWLALMDKPRMREWQAAHDAVAAQLDRGGDSRRP